MRINTLRKAVNMQKIITVITGEVKSSKEDLLFKSSPIGSCIVIAGFDSKQMVSAMAHIMLPGIAPQKYKSPKTRYARNAIDEMIESMIRLGACKENIEVCLVGGSNVLKRKNDTICQANINSVLEILNEKEIKIRAQSLGGTERRNILLETKSGNVYHSIGNEKNKLLSCFITD